MTLRWGGDATRRRPALHLLWALPLASAVAYLLLWSSAFLWCGVWGCSQRGRGGVVEVVLLALAAGAVMGLTVGFVPWTARRGWRAVVGAVVGAVVAGCTGAYVLGL